MKPRDLIIQFTGDPKLKHRYRKLRWVPIPKEVKWKAVILAMRDGNWYLTDELVHTTRMGRKRIRRILGEMVALGVVEKVKTDGHWFYSEKNKYKKGYQWSLNGVVYRMDITKFNITQENTPP